MTEVHNIMYNAVNRHMPLKVVFYKTKMNNQPCRDFLLELDRDERREVGVDIFSVQKGFPLGLPLCRKIENDLWEIRTKVSDGICRVFFTIDNNNLVLLHGFRKKSQRTPLSELKTVRDRLNDYKEQNK